MLSSLKPDKISFDKMRLKNSKPYSVASSRNSRNAKWSYTKWSQAKRLVWKYSLLKNQVILLAEKRMEQKKKTQKKQSFPKYAIFSEIGPLPLSYSGEKVHISGLDFS